MGEKGLADPTPELVRQLPLPVDPHLALGRVDVHVDPLRVEVETEDTDREPGSRKVVEERRPDRLDEGTGEDRSTVDRKVKAARRWGGQRWTTEDARDSSAGQLALDLEGLAQQSRSEHAGRGIP